MPQIIGQLVPRLYVYLQKADDEHRYIISIAVADWSGQAWLQGFNDAGIVIFGMTANELHDLRVRLISTSISQESKVGLDARRE